MGRVLEAQTSAEGEDRDENEVAVGLTSSGGVSEKPGRVRDSRNADNPPIWKVLNYRFCKDKGKVASFL